MSQTRDEQGCRLRTAKPVCSEPVGFRYGLAESRTENPQVMGQVGKIYGSCWCGPLLPDGLQKSCSASAALPATPAWPHALP